MTVSSVVSYTQSCGARSLESGLSKNESDVMDELGNVVVIECEFSARATTYSDVKHPFPNFLNKSSGGRAKFWLGKGKNLLFHTINCYHLIIDNIIIMM